MNVPPKEGKLCCTCYNPTARLEIILRVARKKPGGLSPLIRENCWRTAAVCARRKGIRCTHQWLVRSDWLNPFRTAVPFWGQSSQIPSSWSPKRDCGTERVKLGVTFRVRVISSYRFVSHTAAAINNLLEYRPGVKVVSYPPESGLRTFLWSGLWCRDWASDWLLIGLSTFRVRRSCGAYPWIHMRGIGVVRVV